MACPNSLEFGQAIFCARMIMDQPNVFRADADRDVVRALVRRVPVRLQGSDSCLEWKAKCKLG